MERDVVRFLILVAADISALLVLRGLLLALRDYGVLGGAVAAATGLLLPQGAIKSAELVCALILGLIVVGTYGNGDRRRQHERLIAGSTLGVTLTMWSQLWSNPSPVSFATFCLLIVVLGATFMLERSSLDALIPTFRPALDRRARALLIGPKEDAHVALRHPAVADARDFVVRDSLDLSETNGNESTRIAELLQVISEKRIDTLFLSGPLGDKTFASVLDAARLGGCQVYSLTRPSRWRGVQPEVVWWRGAPLIELTRPSLRGWQVALKRLMDIVLSSMALVVLSPVFVVLAALIKFFSPGPVFFSQTRVGVGGRRFEMLKFRSMYIDAEHRREALFAQSMYGDRRLFKLKDDPRVTPLGRVLRRLSLDELPQFFNVLRGEMSLVGPRPPLPSEVAEYEAHHYARFDVKPGVTGPWQVGGRNLITDFEEVVLLETRYIKEWSIWLDISIMLRTIPTVLSKQGAL